MMGNNPSKFRKVGPSAPVECVSWYDAVKYCNMLSEEQNLPPAYELIGESGVSGEKNYRIAEVRFKGLAATGFRLPTEAEWEYACRAGATTAFTNGEIELISGKDPQLEAVGWFNLNSDKTTHPTREKQPNAWGLYDIHGNVWEWCWDLYGRYGENMEVDPLGLEQGSQRVVRGGAWKYPAHKCRAAVRFHYSQNYRNAHVGFRPVRTWPEASEE